MKIPSEDVEKINNALNSIEGYSIDLINFWESKGGDIKVTIRLTKEK